MKPEPRILLVGDYSKEVVAHLAIPQALGLAAEAVAKSGVDIEGLSAAWVATDSIKSDGIYEMPFSGIWVVPNSPYRSMDGALRAIRHAREYKVPFLGTCGGFQHALIEYARNVLGVADADHAESNPSASTPVIAKMRCSLINQSESITVRPGSRLYAIYGAEQITEAFQCSYGVNAAFEGLWTDAAIKFSAFSWDGSPRALELANHPFFIATLFQPERSAATGEAHPLITAFLRAALSPTS